MLFTQRFWPGIRDGSITMTFRRWKRRQVVAGHRYRTATGIVEVDAVDVVEAETIREAEALASGFPTVAALVAELRGDPGQPVYRVQFHRIDAPDPRDELAHDASLTAADVADLDRRLDRLDQAAKDGPWTAAVLDLITHHPGRRAPDLAEMLGRETQPFKIDVRKLKNLGLTLSLVVGYRVSPRGETYLRQSGRRESGGAEPAGR